MVNILITRQENQAKELAELLGQEGYNSFVEPLFEVKTLDLSDYSLKKSPSFVIITSANAIFALNQFKIDKNTKIYAVGSKTAQKIAEIGYKNIVSTQKYSALALKNLICDNQQEKTGIYLCGSIITIDFSKELQEFGFEIEKILAYKIIESKNLSKQLLKFSEKNNFDIVLLFSQNSAIIFFNLAKEYNLLDYFNNSKILCLSKKIFLQVKALGFQNVAEFKDFKILKEFYD